MNENKVWAVIPAYNEEKNIRDVLKEVKHYVSNVIVVDDGGKDHTTDEAKKEEVIVLRHVLNLGKGSAMKTGCDYAIKNGAEKIILLDADGQHDPKFIPDFIKALYEVDLVFGTRTFTKDMPLLFRFGNAFITLILKMFYHYNLKDTQSGYRGFNKKIYQKIRWKSSSYSVESEMIARAGNNRISFKEVPISTIYNDKYKGTTPFDGVKIVFNLIKWKIFNLR